MIRVLTLFFVFFSLVVSATELKTVNIKNTFKINGDSSSWDIAKSLMTYSGNANFSYNNLSMSGEKIILQRQSKNSHSINKDEVVTVTGQPARLSQLAAVDKDSAQLTSKNIVYQVGSQNISANTQVHLTLVNQLQETLDIKSHSLSLNQQNELKVIAKGSPLKLIVKQHQQAPINAEAKELNFDKKTGIFILNGDVVLTSDTETMKAEKMIYDMNNKKFEMPKSPNKQVEIIQTKKK